MKPLDTLYICILFIGFFHCVISTNGVISVIGARENVCDKGFYKGLNSLKDKFKEDNIKRLIIAECGKNYDENDRLFPFQLMEEITSLQLNPEKQYFGRKFTSWAKYETFTKEEVIEIKKEISNLLNAHNFSLRHYATDKNSSIESNFALWKNEDRQIQYTKDLAAETMDEDWIPLGNTAFTFWIFCIDMICPEAKRSFIEKAEFYDEIYIDVLELDSRGLTDVQFFASSDLSKNANQWDLSNLPVLLRGKLDTVPEVLFGYLYKSGKASKKWLNKMTTLLQARSLLDTIEENFPLFEVKIPGSVENPSWHTKENEIKRHHVRPKKK